MTRRGRSHGRRQTFRCLSRWVGDVVPVNSPFYVHKLSVKLYTFIYSTNVGHRFRVVLKFENTAAKFLG